VSETVGGPFDVNRGSHACNALVKMSRMATLGRATSDSWGRSGIGHWGTCNLANLGKRRTLNGLVARDRQSGSEKVPHFGVNRGDQGMVPATSPLRAKAISISPRIAATMLVSSSGSEVPIAIKRGGRSCRVREPPGGYIAPYRRVGTPPNERDWNPQRISDQDG
jgi:hypothetical protein